MAPYNIEPKIKHQRGSEARFSNSWKILFPIDGLPLYLKPVHQEKHVSFALDLTDPKGHVRSASKIKYNPVSLRQYQSWASDDLFVSDSQTMYEPIFRFSTVGGFWSIWNHITSSCGIYSDVSVMRSGSKPDLLKNSQGACLYIRLRQFDVKNDELFLRVLLGILGETFTEDSYDSFNIKGVTYVNTPYSSHIQIWLRDRNAPIGLDQIAKPYLMLLRYVNIDLPKIFTFVSCEQLLDRTSTDASTSFHPIKATDSYRSSPTPYSVSAGNFD